MSKNKIIWPCLAMVLTLIGSNGWAMSAAAPAPAAAPTPAPAQPMAAPRMTFEFASQDGDIVESCNYALVEATQEFGVTCGEGTPNVKKFTAHVRLFKHDDPNPAANAPKVSYEVLYWVTDYQAKLGEGGHFVGSTTWFRFKDDSALHSISVSQDVEETFELRLDVEF